MTRVDQAKSPPKASTRLLLSVTLFCLLVMAAFAPWWIGSRVFAPLDILNELYEPWSAGNQTPQVHNHFTSDAVSQYLIYGLTAERSFQTDGFIGWNALEGGGYAQYSNTMAINDDWSMQLHRIFDFWTAWHLGLIGQLIIAGTGMIVFLSSRRFSGLLAFAGAIAYALNTQFVLWTFHRWHLGAFAWIPWMLWAMYLYLDGRPWAWPLVPLFMSLAFLGGNLQTNAFVLLVVLVVWMTWLAFARKSRFLETTAHFGVWTLGGIGLAAFALIPNIAAYFDTLAAAQVRGEFEFYSLKTYLSKLAFLLFQPFPSLLGSPQTLDLAKLMNSGLFDVSYFGFVPTLLAFRTLFLRRCPPVARWLMVVGLLIPFTPLAGPLYTRVRLLFVVGGIWAFAWYWQNQATDVLDRVVRWFFYGFVALSVLWVAASLGTVIFEQELNSHLHTAITGGLAAGEGQFNTFHGWYLERTDGLVDYMRIWHPRQLAPWVAAMLGFLALKLRVTRGIRTATWVLLPALTVELLVFASGWVTVADEPNGRIYPITPDILAVQRLVGNGRAYVKESEGEPELLPPNTLTAYGVAAYENYESIIAPRMSAGGASADAASLGSVGVTHAITHLNDRPNGSQWELQYRGLRLLLWRNRLALPRYLGLDYVPGHWPSMAQSLPVGDDPIQVIEATDNHRVLVAPPASAAVRVAENWSDAWYARVGSGSWRQVERAPDQSMLIRLPPSSSSTRVEMAFRPQDQAVGWRISLGTVVFLTVAWWRWARRPSTIEILGPVTVRERAYEPTKSSSR
jgi:hypothetical protein